MKFIEQHLPALLHDKALQADGRSASSESYKFDRTAAEFR